LKASPEAEIGSIGEVDEPDLQEPKYQVAQWQKPGTRREYQRRFQIQLK
jgi:hypothetical protein